MSTVLYLKNVRSGEIHRVFSDGTGKFSKEECNLDDTQEAVAITEEEALKAAPDDRCGHCWAADG